jgi:two-component system chemotaxis response regulator CheY
MKGERILVVDDDDSIRQIVRLFLEDEGFQVLTVPNGQAALDVLETFRPDIILLDLRMPVMDGYEFVSRYRARPAPHAAIVAFDAALNAELERDRIGAATLLEKPFDLEDLLTAVSEARAAARSVTLQANP